MKRITTTAALTGTFSVLLLAAPATAAGPHDVLSDLASAAVSSSTCGEYVEKLPSAVLSGRGGENFSGLCDVVSS
ncbi:hypothetical protein OKJ48_02585 [Streptomyces kunmingensis]|uniref:Secreted protein n=1 Tax=Streptomyces kunmingensis TaxID=68225 RepID=A0ABU6C348_9ACTN|nr:hypothetical protein [Streptomyces kunmingensis]MEB3959148.1 hypothetical protein [Streptomyces kunmingensis]